MHALKVAVLLNVRCLIDPCLLHELGVQTFLRTYFRIDRLQAWGGEVPPPPPCSCCNQQVAGFLMCQPIFINISDFFVLSCSTTECVATVIVDFLLLDACIFTVRAD